MFKRKQDVDKHVNAVLSRKKDDKERNAQGFQIAKLYVEVKEFTTAKKYLSGFLRLREDVPQAHQLLGDINIALGKKDEAIDNYKKALSLGGGFANSNRQLVKKICELYCESNADVQEMKFWLDKCEALCPKDDVIFKLKVKITDALNGDVENNSVNKENLIASELVNQPTNKELRIRLLSSYLESGKLDEAYENAVKTDLTTAFVDQLQWYELLSTVFQEYGSKNPDSHSEPSHNEHFLHILRNLTYLSLWKKDVTECVYALNRFDKYLKKAFSLANQDESWIAMLKEMKGQLFFLSALLLLKKAQNGLLKWQEANQMAGACFLASRTVSPLDAQAPWFVTAPQDHSKFYNWWYLQSYDRLSQVGHMLLRLSNGDMVEWTRTIKQHVMTAAGHQKIFRATFSPRDLKDQGQASFFFQVTEMSDSTDTKEPLTERHMLDIDRVAYQVHLSDLSHLVWLCLQRYSPDKEAQPNYHFNILENIQYSVKNVDNAGAESLCQLDVLVFLLATVKCASSSLTENKYLYDDNSGQPSLLPLCLSKPLCTQDQNEWWTTAYKFCTNSLKEDFSKYRRVLIRGIETVRLLGTHGMSIPMTTHIAKSLDAKVSSIEKAELGCRCPASELSALETRAAYYWEKVKQMLEKLDRNQFTPVSKNRLFKEAGDSEKDLPARLIKKLTAESTFALSVAAMKQGRYEEALNGFSKHTSPWAKYHSAQIYKSLAEQEERNDEYSPKKQILLQKAQESLYGVMDKLAGDKSHQLNVLVSREMDAIESQIHSFEYDDREASSSSSFHTPSKYPGEIKSTPSTNGPVHSTPRNLIPSSYAEKGFDTAKGTPEPHLGRRDFNVSSTSDHHDRPRPSPERLESQIRSLTHSQSSLFKMVLDRNEELILINGKMIEELRDNNNQLKSVLTENKSLMEELKNFLVDNRDTMKEIKSELTALKAGHIAAATPPIPPAQPLFMPPIPATAPARGPYPGYPAPAYSGYVINGPVPPPQAPPLAAAGPHYRPTGLPGSRSSNVGKYRQSEEEDEEEEDLGAIEREYFDTDQSYTQYYPADSHMIQDWSVSGRTGLDGQPPLPIPALQQRMTMPAPGYFASALRGQALQYAQSTPSPGQVNPQLGPGFFSTPAAPGIVATPVVPVSLGISPINTVKPADSTPTLMVGALPGHGSITKGISKPVLPSSSSEMSSARNTESRVKSLFQARAVMEPKKTPGNITISFDTLVNRATILMMSDAKEILFHHDINGIKLEPSFVPTNVVWTGIKVGSQEAERMSVALENAGLASQLKDALQKAAYLIQTEVSPAQAVSTTPSAPATVPAVAATSTTQDAGKEVPKPTFGGFTFSTKPTVQENTERPKSILAKSSPAAAPVTDSPKPFAGFSLTPSSAATKPEVKFTLPAKSDVPSLFSTKSPGEVSSPAAAVRAKGPVVPPAKSPGALPKSPGATDDDHVEEYEPNVEFKPVISLPELVDKKTGEENEMEVFVERCRLFRFDHDSKQWKERGVGEMKILKSKDNVKFRIIMRRDQILKLCANHFLNATMHLTPMATSDRAWCYSAMDFSEEEMKLEQLAVKFKNAEKASLFQTVFEDCCRQLKDAESSSSTESKDDVKDKGQTPRVSTDSAKQPTNANKPLSELFKPKTGSWECQGCYIRSNDDVLKCPACGTAKPGGAAAPVSKPAVASTATKPAGASSSAVKPLSELFKPSTGSWECDACLVRNKADVVKCLACNTLKPGAKVTEAPQSSSGAANIASITGGAAGTGFNFGAASSSTPAVSTTGGGFSFSTPAASSSSSSGFKFGSPATFGGSPAPSGGFKFGAANAPSSTPAATTPSLSDAKPGTGSGFKFDAQSTSSATPGFSFGPASEQKGPSSGFVFGTPSLKPSALGAPVSNLFGAPAPAATSGGSIFGAPRAATPGSGSIFGGAAPAATPGSSVFGAPTPSANSFSSDKAPVKEGSKGPDTSGLLAKLLTSDDTPSSTTKPQSGFSFTMPAKPTTPVANQSAASTPGFQFSFNKSPAKSGVPQSPEVDDHGLYVNKEGDDSHIHFEPVVALPDKVEVKTGEEDENILFENRGKMYRFVSGEWKEKGVGVLKILEHKATKKTRVLMRRDQVLKICCNHMIDSALSLQPMAKSEGKAWVWYALDFTEEGGQMEQLAIRFRTAEIAFEFKTVFEKCRDSASSTSPAKPPVDLSKHGAVKKELFQADVDDSASDDVIFLGEEKPTQDQLDRARKYQLPDHFYLYESRPPCPGCIGCNDGELPAATAVAMSKPTTAGTVSTPTTAATVSTSTKQDTVVKPPQVLQSPAFGRAIVPAAGDTPTRKESSGFVLGANVNVDFSSLASSTSSQGFTWQKAETSSPFKFAGAGQKLFGGGGSPAADGKGDAEDGEDGSIVQSDDIHFEPVIPLPDLVEVKTGEEDWSPLFCQRAKLYKFDKSLGQWKERGIGDMKIMSHKTEHMYRILQRREQVLKVSCNHLINVDMDLKPMATSETSWCWVATDYTETEPSIEQFAVKFKNKEIANQFREIFSECQENLRQEPDSTGDVVEDVTGEVGEDVTGEVVEDVTGEEGGEDYEEYEEEEEEEEEDDRDKVLLEKRVTLSSLENGSWKKLGLGNLLVKFNEDLSGNSIEFNTDGGEKLCNHVICQEHAVSVDLKKHACEWKPIDYSTDDPIRKHFSAAFSSGAAAQEFAQIFTQSQQLAAESEISENVLKEIDIPEIFSAGEAS